MRKGDNPIPLPAKVFPINIFLFTLCFLCSCLCCLCGKNPTLVFNHRDMYAPKTANFEICISNNFTIFGI